MRRSVQIRRVITGILAATTAVALTACGSSGPGTLKAGEPSKVQVWALQDAAVNPIATSSIDAYNKANGTKIELVTYVNDAYKQKLQVAMGSPAAPDVFFNWGGLPMLGVLPVVLFINKDVFAAAGVQPPKTYADLLSLVDTFKAKGVTPIALAGSQGWTELMWLEYLLDRIGGADKFANIAAGKEGAWQDPTVVKALGEIQTFVKRGAFGTNFASVNYDNQGASKLFATGKAAMHLMGTWDFSVQKDANPDFIKNGKLGFTAFPAFEGGAGDPKSVVGNPSNYYSVNAASKSKDASIDFLAKSLTSDQYINGLIDAGQVPAVKGVETTLKSKPNADFTGFTYDLVANAPSFTQSWDQALSPSVSTELLTNLQKLFLGQVTPEAFVANMAKVK
ncbi:extracellular solute-binding protein [Dactylosporangium sp. NPDC050588]|uniref:extracellular solute-binding protein n=1 Tax=Dactylosporangium sp. NPDC050588 TaxID=3157211 RepID=UPI0033C445F6